MKRKKYTWWRVLMALSTVILCGFLISSTKQVSAADESDTWIIPMGSANAVQETTKTDGEYIIQTGTHIKGTSNILYRTSGKYMMTLESHPETLTSEGAFDTANRAFVPVMIDDIVDGSIVNSTYTIKKQDFLDAMQKLGVTSAMLMAHGGSINVYISNIFEIYNPDTDLAYRGYTNIIGYKEMINEGKRITDGYGWSTSPNGGTTEILKSYYNYPYVVTPTLFNVDVVAVDENHTVLGTIKTGDSGMFNEKYPLNSTYTAPFTYTKNGITYRAKNTWYCQYTKRVGSTLINGDMTTGSTIYDYGLPDAKKGSTVKMCVVYEKIPGIVINAIDKDDGHTIQASMYSGTVTAGENFVKNINSIIIKDGATYKKTVEYYYTYTNVKGVSSRTGGVTDDEDDAIAFSIPSDIKNAGVITVNVYYKKQVLGNIPVTVTAVNKTNGTIIQTLTTGILAAGGVYGYTVSSSLTSGTKTYQYSGEWNWRYTQNSSTAPIIVKTGSGTNISFTAPSADNITGGITVKVYYDDNTPPANEIKLRVIMVSSTGTLIDEISEEKVTRSQAISKTIAGDRSVSGVVYKYLNNWDYTYYTSPTATTTRTGTGTTASFSIPATTAFGTIVTLKLYYNATQPVEVPDTSAPITVSLDIPDPYGVINGDKYNSSYFTSKLGISTTESQYVYVKSKDYLLGYTLVNRTGKVDYYVPVTMNYTLNYYTATPEAYGGPEEVTETVHDTQSIKVEKAYSYWEVTNLEFYYIGTANVYNYSLPGGNVTLSANSAYLDIPSLSTSHSSDIRDHVIAPEQVAKGIVLNASEPVTSETSDRPVVEYEDLTAYAITMTDEAKVKNDFIMFDGSTVLSSAVTEKIAPNPNTSAFVQSSTITPDKALYTEGKVIDAVKENGTYSSNGSVTYYLNPMSVNATFSNRTFNTRVNSVILHTPVICDPVITADNDKWSQLIKPVEGAIQVVLDPDTTLNDFTVKVSNTLQHSNRLGYFIRDFSRSFIDPINISYIAKTGGVVRNEMKLPFDVYVDTSNDGIADNDKYIKAGTWFVLGRNTYRFYVPMWVQEGTYTAEFRTIAVNGINKLEKAEITRNSSLNNYVATSTETFQISGRIYGLTLYDVSDYPKWENIFRVKDTMMFKLFEGATDGTKRTGYNVNYAYYYKLGTRNQYGIETGSYSKYTLPLVSGSHPQYKNLGVLKTGYATRFMLDTTGELYSSACHIKVTPTFYYVDADAKNRQSVDLYYDEEINGKQYKLVKAGKGIDLVNIQSGNTGNVYSRIPEDEIKNTAAVLNTTYSKIANQKSTMYSYTAIKLLNAFRTFIGLDYASNITDLSSFNDVKTNTGLTELSLSKYKQRWYGTYKIPTNVHAVPTGYDVYGYMKKKGIDYGENFWLTGGYIIVNFNIVTIDKNGVERLSYINGNNYLNNGNCSMWVTEGAAVQKTDSNGKVFNFKAGDFIVYNTDKKYSDDYEGNLY